MDEPRRQSYWMSYSDLATCLLLVFVLILTSVLMIYGQTVKAIIGVREQLIEELADAFSEENQMVRVDEKTGALELPTDLLFEFDSSELSARGKAYLDDFIPKYFKVVLAPKYEKNMAEVVIEGHADPSGEYLHNLRLSQERAYSVLLYILGTSLGDEEAENRLKQIVSASGRSESDPIEIDGRVDSQRSRRVAVKFRLRDGPSIERLRELLGE